MEKYKSYSLIAVVVLILGLMLRGAVGGLLDLIAIILFIIAMVEYNKLKKPKKKK